VVGPFEEEEEGMGMTSNVVKVKGEHPSTSGHLSEDRLSLITNAFRLLQVVAYYIYICIYIYSYAYIYVYICIYI